MSLFYLRRENPALLARLIAYNRVQRGIRWLQENAPAEWPLHFFSLYPGRWQCRARISYDNEHPLAIAFESRPEYANDFGYVTYASVLNRLAALGIVARHNAGRFVRTLGFEEDILSGFVTNDLLDAAWKDEVLRVHHGRLLSPRHYSRHDRELDRRADRAMRSLKRRLRLPT